MANSIRITSDVNDCDCAACKDRLGFELPVAVVDAALNGNLVIFAGAGVSTENEMAFPTTLYDEVRSELSIGDAPPFSDVMERYCNQPNGRAMLLNRIRLRFERAKLWPETLRACTRFHNVIATIPQIEDIVTTNWDDFFEITCNATPFVNGEDFVFWNSTGRKVFKIHGSINNFGSMVATPADFERRYRELESGIMGSALRLMLATKTVVFAGYSLRDPQFVQLYQTVVKDMSGMNQHPYIVTIDRDSPERFEELGLTPIITDATFFIEHLRKQLVQRGHLIDDSRFQGVIEKAMEIEEKHKALWNMARHSPAVLYAAMFQDGVLSAFGHVLAARSTGTFYSPDRVRCLLHRVEESIREAKDHGRFEDVAYLQGRLDGFLFTVTTDDVREHFPCYFVFGVEGAIRTEEEFLEDLERAEELHPEAFARAKLIMDKYSGDRIAIHHVAHAY